MGRGLSELQKTVLRVAGEYEDETTFFSEVLIAHYGWESGWNMKWHDAPVLRMSAIGEGKYRSGQAALSRAVRRLAERGLVRKERVSADTWGYYKRTAVVLTDDGKREARRLRL